MSEVNVTNSEVVQTGTQVQGNGMPLLRDTEETRRLKKNFGFFGPVTFIYAVFYAFCMFQNDAGITFPFFIAASLVFLCYTLSKLELTLRKGSSFYMVSMMLLAVSTFCTADGRIINLNKLGIFLLMMSLLLNQFYDTGKWKLVKYLSAILEMAVMCLGELGRPIADGAAHYRQQGGRNRKLWYGILGVIVALPLLFVVVLLLGSADVLFRSIAQEALEFIQPGNLFNILLRIAFIFFGAYGLIAYLCKRCIKEEVEDKRTGEPILAITVTTILTLVYLLFSGIQIFGLFLRQLELPAGYSYAVYAREGFFQLLTVSLINLGIVLVCLSYFKESRLLKIILTVMSFCTFVMIASSFARMLIYIYYYDLTFQRILVMWSLAVLFMLFVGVIINIFKEAFPLFRYSMVVVTVCYLLLSFSHPDYFIATVNVSKTGSPDCEYLSTLSADAAPILLPYEMEQYYKTNYVYHIMDEVDDLNWRTFNVSRYMAALQLKR